MEYPHAERTTKIGLVCSSFDLCHAGHMLMLKDAKSRCDYLVIGLQTDPTLDNDTNNEYRGKLKNKPIMSVEERRIILESTKYVDELFTYTTEADLREKISRLPFHLRVQGSDWEGKKYTGYDLPNHETYFHKRSHSYSTSALRERIYFAEKEMREESVVVQNVSEHNKPVHNERMQNNERTPEFIPRFA